MKYLLTSAAILLAAPAVAEFNSTNPITVEKVEAQLDSIYNLMATLDLSDLKDMIKYDSEDVVHREIIPGSLSFGTSVDLVYPDVEEYPYAVLSYDVDEFNDARDAFIEEINMFFVDSKDGSIDFINYNTNEGVLGKVANMIVDEWDAMHVHISNLESDPTSGYHWTQAQAHAAALQQLNTRYDYIYNAYAGFLAGIEAWDSTDVDAYLAAVNKAARDAVVPAE